MYCRNCGSPVAANAAVCVKCGYAVGTGVNFCPNCGAPSTPGAAVCVNCGTAFCSPVNVNEQKSSLVAGLLAILLGTLGIHNFYLGFTGKAVAQLLMTVCSCGFLAMASGIWALVEGIMIFTGSINMDAAGVPLKS